jgi:hypothetical protein
MIRKYDQSGITLEQIGTDLTGLASGADPYETDVEHFELDGQPPVATGGSWYAPYTGT